MNITKATIMARIDSADEVIVLETDLPTAHPSMNYPCTLLIQTEAGYGKTWVQENYPGVPIEIAETLVEDYE